MLRVLVGVPIFEHEEVRYAESVGLAIKSDLATVGVVRVVGTNTPNARNIVVRKALDGNYDYVLFFDADMVYPSSTLDKLLAHDKDIVGGYYHAVRDSHLVQVFCKGDDGNYMDFIPKSRGLVKVDCVGGGCMLVRTKVFKSVSFPWFNYELIGDVLSTEDTTFSRKASAAGYKIYCDAGVRCGHVGKFVVWPDDEISRVRLESARTS